MKRFINSWIIITAILFNWAFSQITSLNYLNRDVSDNYICNPNTNEIYLHNKFTQQINSSQKIATKVSPLFYLHFYGGIGFSFLSSSKIKSLLGGDFGIGIGLPTWSWGLISGYKNIVQIEYNNGISDHDFNNNSIIPGIPSKVIKMDYKTTDWQFKLNPLFWKMKDNKAYFIIIGTGNVKWLDKNRDGFNGTSQIIGLEYAQLKKFVSWSVSLKRYGITFEKTTLFNVPFDLKTQATDYILEFKIGFGYGI